MNNIPTMYRGYKMRSRTEARWAVAFDAAGLKWSYEAEGKDLDGEWYLPDFRLDLPKTGTPLPFANDMPLWVEVKPRGLDEKDARKIKAFAKNHLLLVLGDIPENYPEYMVYQNPRPCGVSFHSFMYINGTASGALFTMSSSGGVWLIPNCGRYGFLGNWKKKPELALHPMDVWDGGKLMRRMFAAARSAQFEHGATPEVEIPRWPRELNLLSDVATFACNLPYLRSVAGLSDRREFCTRANVTPGDLSNYETTTTVCRNTPRADIMAKICDACGCPWKEVIGWHYERVPELKKLFFADVFGIE